MSNKRRVSLRTGESILITVWEINGVDLLYFQIFIREFLGGSVVIFFFIIIFVKNNLKNILDFHVLSHVYVSEFLFTHELFLR